MQQAITNPKAEAEARAKRQKELWQMFCEDAADIDGRYIPEVIKDILKKLGITKMNDESYKALVAFKEDGRLDKYFAPLTRVSTQEWNYICPVCGAPTTREISLDYRFRSEATGWICNSGGKTHFFEAAWLPVKRKWAENDQKREEVRF